MSRLDKAERKYDPGPWSFHFELTLTLLALKKYMYAINVNDIRKTCPCNVYPLGPHFYFVKMGFAGVYLFFLFLLQNKDCGYSFEPPWRGGSNVNPQSMF